MFQNIMLLFILSIILRTIYIVKEDLVIAPLFTLLECIAWVYVVSLVISSVDQGLSYVLSYSLGFAVGTLLGILLVNYLTKRKLK